jgi:hypothetical protein
VSAAFLSSGGYREIDPSDSGQYRLKDVTTLARPAVAFQPLLFASHWSEREGAQHPYGREASVLEEFDDRAHSERGHEAHGGSEHNRAEQQ